MHEIHLPVNAEVTAAAAIHYARDCICGQAPSKRNRQHLDYVWPHLRLVHVTATLRCCWFYRTTAQRTINNNKSVLVPFFRQLFLLSIWNYFSTSLWTRQWFMTTRIYSIKIYWPEAMHVIWCLSACLAIHRDRHMDPEAHVYRPASRAHVERLRDRLLRQPNHSMFPQQFQRWLNTPIRTDAQNWDDRISTVRVNRLCHAVTASKNHV